MHVTLLPLKGGRSVRYKSLMKLHRRSEMDASASAKIKKIKSPFMLKKDLSLIGRDIYSLLLKYLLRALRSQFNLRKKLKQWPSNPLTDSSQIHHSVTIYLAKHAILTMHRFYELFRNCEAQAWTRINIFNCPCGKQFGVSFWQLHKNAIQHDNTNLIINRFIYWNRKVSACLMCTKPCEYCEKVPILKDMVCCDDCTVFESSDEFRQNTKAIDEWLALQKHPF